jgi:alpha-ribazole phosphatase
MRLLLMRHGPVDVAPGICYGVSDVAALPFGSATLALPDDAHIVSSTSSRCRDLALSLADGRRAVHLDARLREIDFGEWELLRYDEIDRALIDAWAAAPWTFLPPGGESADAMSVRVVAAFEEAVRRARDAGSEALVVVSHGGPLRVMRGSVLGLPREQWLGFDWPFGMLLELS